MMMVVSKYLCNKKTHSLVLDSILWSKGGLETQLTAVIFPHTRNTLRSKIIPIWMDPSEAINISNQIIIRIFLHNAIILCYIL